MNSKNSIQKSFKYLLLAILFSGLVITGIYREYLPIDFSLMNQRVWDFSIGLALGGVGASLTAFLMSFTSEQFKPVDTVELHRLNISSEFGSTVDDFSHFLSEYSKHGELYEEKEKKSLELYSKIQSNVEQWSNVLKSAVHQQDDNKAYLIEVKNQLPEVLQMIQTIANRLVLVNDLSFKMKTLDKQEYPESYEQVVHEAECLSQDVTNLLSHTVQSMRKLYASNAHVIQREELRQKENRQMREFALQGCQETILLLQSEKQALNILSANIRESFDETKTALKVINEELKKSRTKTEERISFVDLDIVDKNKFWDKVS